MTVRNSLTMKELLVTHKDVAAIKIDVEGEEIDILETASFLARIKTLVFEYSFSRDPNVTRFKNLMAKLKQRFSTVKYPRSALARPRLQDGTWVTFNHRGVIVHCAS